MKRLLFVGLALVFVFNLSAQENLVTNGDFSDKYSGWSLNSGSATASIKIVSERAHIEIAQPGSDVSQPQLVQSGIALEYSEAYELSFFASATQEVAIQAVVGGNGITYSNEGSGTVVLTTKSQNFSVPFFMESPTDGNAELQFNLGNAGADVTIAIDSVRLITNPNPMIYVRTPDSETQWITGKEEKIQWSNSGDIDAVKIQFSNNGGAAWSTIVAEASNEREFTWSIPTDAAGDECLIIVSDLEGTVSDTTNAFVIYEAGSVPAGEKVDNGQFVGNAKEWSLEVVGGHARGAVVDGEYRIDSIGGFETTPENWQVKLSQSGISLESGKLYTLTFDAYASAPRAIYANVGPNGAPYTVYGGDTVALELTTTKETFSASFLTEQDWENVRVEFNCAADTEAVFIDNVSLVETDASQFIITKPVPNSTLKAGGETTIEWNNLEIANVTIEFSSDSGEQWQIVEEGIANFGEIDWSIPQVSSQDCYIRIKDGDADSVLGKSSRFGINSFGKPVEKGELITNGDFSDGLAGWNALVLENGAAAEAEIRDEVLKIGIDESGDELSDIVLSQNSMPILQGEEYEFSFLCHAAGQRSMRVILKDSEDPLVVVIDSTIQLPTSSTKISWAFTAPQDISAKVEFHLGSSAALVSLDNVSLWTQPDVSVSPRNATRMQGRLTLTAQQLANSVIFVVGRNVTGNMDIYAIDGSKIRSLKASERIVWDGRNSRGSSVAAGSYIAVLRSAQGSLTSKFILR